ncbi:MAG: hypothetical protein LAO23_19730 [Acidobacteriia bacterium]|nr:hypothetical protein [Terriglobia bacterium]
MLTGHDKAIVALILAIAGASDSFGLTHWGLQEGTVTAVVSAISPILVWIVPNKGAAA